ncbi:MAG: tetratricopeptide repeat protein [Clostridiales bacterium]|nr:tetratricopeptide repeat protein [Clostridiales bacterium]
MAKKIAIAVWILTAAFLGILVLNYFGNRKMIENFDNGNYQQNEMGFLGFTQPYINHFNKGNVFYKLGDYQKAKEEYQLALNLKPQDPYDCKIRVNYALSYVTPIDVKSITEDNYEDIIEICETAKSILAEKDCATANNDGHYYAAQKLYNEINDFIESLRNQFENPPTDTPTPTPTPDPSNGTATPTPSPKPDADATETPTPTPSGEESPTPTPQGGEETPTPTPQGGEETPTPTPQGGEDTPTPTPGDGTPTPTPGGDNGETPTPTPGDGTPTPTPGGENGETPTPTPGGDQGTPTPTPGGEGDGTPTPTPGGDGQGTPTPTPGGDGQGTPTPTPGEGHGTPTPTQSPEDQIREIQDRSNRERYGGSGDYNDEYNFGNSSSW